MTQSHICRVRYSRASRHVARPPAVHISSNNYTTLYVRFDSSSPSSSLLEAQVSQTLQDCDNCTNWQKACCVQQLMLYIMIVFFLDQTI